MGGRWRTRDLFDCTFGTFFTGGGDGGEDGRFFVFVLGCAVAIGRMGCGTTDSIGVTVDALAGGGVREDGRFATRVVVVRDVARAGDGAACFGK